MAFEGPFKLTPKANVSFENTGDAEGYWRADGRFAWAGDNWTRNSRQDNFLIGN
jgi:hypothetical protein